MTRLRPLAVAVQLVLIGCAFLQSTVPTVPPPQKSTPAATPRRIPTPFAPNAPTPTPLSSGDPADPAWGWPWPAPFTYGSAPTPPVPIPDPVAPLPLPDNALSVLLLGSDRRGGSGFRTDTILVATLRPDDGLVVLLSIPRDLYLVLPGYGMSRINSAWIYGQSFGYPGGGPQMLIDTIRYNLGLRVDRYALVEMAGFRQIVDLLGGVDVRVACSYTDWKLRRPELPESLPGSWALFTVPQGIVHMNGDDALWYARARLRSSDFDRSRRQHEVLRAISRQARRPAILTRLPELYAALQGSVVTNVSLQDVLTLTPFVAGLQPAHLRSRFIGRDQVHAFRVPVSGAAVQLPDPAAIRILLEEAYAPIAVEGGGPGQVRVELVPGLRPDLTLLAQERLAYFGIDGVILESVTPADGATRLWVPAGTPEESVQTVIDALGLSRSGVIIAASEGEGPALRLQVGEDFQPCFDPTRDQ